MIRIPIFLLILLLAVGDLQTSPIDGSELQKNLLRLKRYGRKYKMPSYSGSQSVDVNLCVNCNNKYYKSQPVIPDTITPTTPPPGPGG
ncbi:Hypothetical predicted protein [Mytilus galloprovincialis]|uniref:Uncharacterized protein n=1 Tax=Mytilus galloprovincialis TaxID=29158 RepID=A0A8B6C6N9_MYTGA|nr:Hypothetical predicted protein [Mytilus galloprovincialis]